MRWDKMRESQNVEEVGGQSSGQGGGLRLGLGGIAVVVVLGLLLGKNPLEILGLVTQMQGGAVPHSQTAARPVDAKSHEFVARVLGDTEDTWQQIYQSHGQQYQLPKLVSFQGSVKSACGNASAAMGPFYCPADQKVYLDYAFFDELHRKFGAPGDFAQAYVIAHEVGHHVQNLMGLSAKVHQQQQRLSKAEGNALSVRLELQADCFAGVWGHSAAQRGLLDAADMDEALAAANAIGDDTLQKSAGHAVVPDAFTHGSSEQRMRWFKRGMENGDIKACNTFDSNVAL
ncbi:zinc metallopeptidase [Chitinibacter bivalviorum]|uniref:Zinc metallopeptidase n=1 Tax=Chitinibacter bivalviorum TaxID=2739434 RepID=A0A7H9BFB2_9NEIS|nr:neutral zinc metallopeptidase [Chitinibacter bivalviorum]QLG87255.1 zinc metallopeptidase [Chitinibacter bivalviorum]